MTFGLLATFAIFTLLGFARGDSANMQPLFPQPGSAGVLLSIFLVLQIVPYFMTGFESVAKGSEEAKAASIRATSRRRSTPRCSPACSST